ncbi:hypothetical protein [Methylorubrum salsuginis]|uniref:hypothetical protein n=1 Tax=Methylorubrum salsuginis TaxID=414703 RepID=UPI001041CAFB|nr:hypothetical protein [Methylorubrum salsuginis]
MQADTAGRKVPACGVGWILNAFDIAVHRKCFGTARKCISYCRQYRKTLLPRLKNSSTPDQKNCVTRRIGPSAHGRSPQGGFKGSFCGRGHVPETDIGKGPAGLV